MVTSDTCFFRLVAAIENNGEGKSSQEGKACSDLLVFTNHTGVLFTDATFVILFVGVSPVP